MFHCDPRSSPFSPLHSNLRVHRVVPRVLTTRNPLAVLGFEVLYGKFAISEDLKIIPSFYVGDPAQVLRAYPGSR
jgi:hypothetical protein